MATQPNTALNVDEATRAVDRLCDVLSFDHAPARRHCQMLDAIEQSATEARRERETQKLARLRIRDLALEACQAVGTDRQAAADHALGVAVALAIPDFGHGECDCAERGQ